MAMFGDDAQPYVTPDGRTVTLPSQLAAQYPGLAPAQETPGPGAPPPGSQPVALPSGGSPAFTPADQAGLRDLTPQPTPADAVNAPVTSPSQVPSGGPPQTNHVPVTSPVQAADGGPPNAPGPDVKTPTQDQLAHYTEAQRVSGESGALDQSAAAVKEAGTAEANKLQKVGDFQQQVADEAMRQTAARAAQAQEQDKQRQAQLDKLLTAATQIQNTKVDRSLDHPVLTGIGIALGALGQIWNKSNVNVGMQAMYQAIDRKVAAQMQDLETKRANLGLMRDQYGLQREQDKDRLAEQDAHRIAYLDDAAKKMTAMATQMDSPIAKANADKALADIAQKKQDIINGAADRIYAKQQADLARKDRLSNEAAGRAVTMRGQDMEDRRFYYGQQQQEREHMATLSAQLLERGDKVAAERAKRVGELGVIDPSTGNVLLTPEGQKKMDQADQMEAAARKASDPAQAQQLTQQAQQLRDAAKVNDSALAPTTEGAKNAEKVMAFATNAQQNLDEAREMLKAGPSAFNREAWSKITVAMEGVKTNYAGIMGDKISVKMLDAIDEITGIDTNSMYQRSANKDKAIAALGSIETQMKSRASTALLANGIQTPWSPARPLDNVEDKIGSGGQGDHPGMTALEAEADNRPGWLARIGGRIARPVGGADSFDFPGRAFNETAQASGKDSKGNVLPPSSYGIDPADDARVRAKIKQSATVGNKKYGQIVDTLTQPLLSERPGLAVGVARILNDEDPRLLNDVLARVAASPGGGEQKAKAIAEAAKSVAQKVPAIGQFGPPPGPVPAYRPPAPPLPPGALASPPPPQDLPLSLSAIKHLSPAQQTQYKQWLDANGFLPAEQ